LLINIYVSAQVTTNPQLDKCIKSKKVLYTVTGAAAGAASGLLASVFGVGGKSKKSTAENIIIGAVAGGAIGYATAYYKAAANCLKEHPEWIPESEITRSESYTEAVKELSYNPNQGLLVKVSKVDMDSTVKPGDSLEISSTFIVLTPNGEESNITIIRKLYAIADGKEEEIPFLGRESEERTVEAGKHTDTVHLPIPAEVKPGTTYKFEFGLKCDNAQPSSNSATVSVS